MENRRGATEARLSVTHDEAMTDPELRTRYRNERVALVKAGRPVWILHGFEIDTPSSPGYMMDYYQDGQRSGYIVGNDSDGYHVYGLGTGVDEDRPHHINSEPVENEMEAQRMLTELLEGVAVNRRPV